MRVLIALAVLVALLGSVHAQLGMGPETPPESTMCNPLVDHCEPYEEFNELGDRATGTCCLPRKCRLTLDICGAGRVFNAGGSVTAGNATEAGCCPCQPTCPRGSVRDTTFASCCRPRTCTPEMDAESCTGRGEVFDANGDPSLPGGCCMQRSCDETRDTCMAPRVFTPEGLPMASLLSEDGCCECPADYQCAKGFEFAADEPTCCKRRACAADLDAGECVAPRVFFADGAADVDGGCCECPADYACPPGESLDHTSPTCCTPHGACDASVDACVAPRVFVADGTPAAVFNTGDGCCQCNINATACPLGHEFDATYVHCCKPRACDAARDLCTDPLTEFSPTGTPALEGGCCVPRRTCVRELDAPSCDPSWEIFHETGDAQVSCCRERPCDVLRDGGNCTSQLEFNALGSVRLGTCCKPRVKCDEAVDKCTGADETFVPNGLAFLGTCCTTRPCDAAVDRCVPLLQVFNPAGSPANGTCCRSRPCDEHLDRCLDADHEFTPYGDPAAGTCCVPRRECNAARDLCDARFDMFNAAGSPALGTCCVPRPCSRSLDVPPHAHMEFVPNGAPRNHTCWRPRMTCNATVDVCADGFVFAADGSPANHTCCVPLTCARAGVTCEAWEERNDAGNPLAGTCCRKRACNEQLDVCTGMFRFTPFGDPQQENGCCRCDYTKRCPSYQLFDFGSPTCCKPRQHCSRKLDQCDEAKGFVFDYHGDPTKPNGCCVCKRSVAQCGKRNMEFNRDWRDRTCNQDCCKERTRCDKALDRCKRPFRFAWNGDVSKASGSPGSCCQCDRIRATCGAHQVFDASSPTCCSARPCDAHHDRCAGKYSFHADGNAALRHGEVGSCCQCDESKAACPSRWVFDATRASCCAPDASKCHMSTARCHRFPGTRFSLGGDVSVPLGMPGSCCEPKQPVKCVYKKIVRRKEDEQCARRTFKRIVYRAPQCVAHSEKDPQHA